MLYQLILTDWLCDKIIAAGIHRILAVGLEGIGR